MANRITKLWGKFRQTVRGADSNRQLALGVTLGMLIGILPKDSLFTVALAVILLISNANLLTAACSVVLFSLIGVCLDPLTHEIGVRILTFDPFETLWAGLINLPLVAWTRFDNSVVMGSLIIGLLICVPVYRASFRFFDTYGSPIFDLCRESAVATWLIGPSQSKLTGGHS